MITFFQKKFPSSGYIFPPPDTLVCTGCWTRRAPTQNTRSAARQPAHRNHFFQTFL